MAKKRKNFIREKRIYCGEEYLEVDIVAVTNMPEAGKGKKGKSSQAQKNLNDKRSKRRFVQIANTNFGTNDFHISATYKPKRSLCGNALYRQFKGYGKGKCKLFRRCGA